MTQIEYIPGDWVKASGQLCRVEEVFVNRLTKEYEYTLIYPNGNSSRIVIGEIEPVPLTPEILDKSGWELTDREDNYYIFFKYGNPVSLHYFSNRFFSIYIHYENSMFNIEYVHELQHLLLGLVDNSELKI